MHLDDAQLVLSCLDGDTDAYNTLTRRYQSSVYATAYYYVGRYGAAEDVAQDALLEGYRRLPRLRNPERFGPWLKEMTCRTAANWLRRNAERLNQETPLPYKRTISIEDARATPGRSSENKEQLERIQRAIDSLPERYRLPVVLRFLQELSYDEISAYTGDSKDEIRGVLQRAGRQLRNILAEGEAVPKEGESNWHRARE